MSIYLNEIDIASATWSIQCLFKSLMGRLSGEFEFIFYIFSWGPLKAIKSHFKFRLLSGQLPHSLDDIIVGCFTTMLQKMNEWMNEWLNELVCEWASEWGGCNEVESVVVNAGRRRQCFQFVTNRALSQHRAPLSAPDIWHQHQHQHPLQHRQRFPKLCPALFPYSDSCSPSIILGTILGPTLGVTSSISSNAISKRLISQIPAGEFPFSILKTMVYAFK